MKKVIGYSILSAILLAVWYLYASSGDDIQSKKVLIENLTNAGDREGKVSDLKAEVQMLEGQKTFNGILLAFLSAGVVGIAFVFEILPLLAHKMTHAVYDSAEMVERDIMRDARSLFAQGEYEAAVGAFRKAAEADPDNRFPWVEMAKIQKDNLHDPAAAIATIQEALEKKEWQFDDAAFFLFRLVELYDESIGDRATATGILHQVVELFPETRHSANALHKLREWEHQAAAAANTEDGPA